MKSTRYIIILLSSAILASCSFLDVSVQEYHGTNYQFSTFDRTKQVLTNVYGYLPQGWGSGTKRDVATDNATVGWETDGIKKYWDGSWSAISGMDDVWWEYYHAIRAANYFLENCPDDFEATKYRDDYSQRMEQLQYFPWEARALRAYFHYELLKRYRNIIVSDHCIELDEVNKLAPSSYDEAVSWIAAECDTVAMHLPISYKFTWAQETNRVTKGFALALKARVLLYAASPLNNPTNDKSKWEAAAAAAKAVMDLGPYMLESYDKWENKAVIDCYSVIFSITTGQGGGYESDNFPIGYEGGNGGICPSLNLFSCFDFTDGTEFDWNNPDHRARMYTDRDPRLYSTMLFNGSAFKEVNLETFYGGQNGLPRKGATNTSFYLNKLIIQETSFITGNSTSYEHYWPVFRIHEMYLNYAEALFEATGDPSFTGTLNDVNYKISPKGAVDAVRAAAGMPAISSGLTGDAFRTKLRKERRVEFAFEDHYFWDVRRWKIGESTQDVYGLSITRIEDGDKDSSNDRFNTEKVLVQHRVWKDKYYFYPIDQGELFKNNSLIQNEGWEIED